jgi:hypothetical protein
LDVFDIKPSVETPGYFHLSFRDIILSIKFTRCCTSKIQEFIPAAQQRGPTTLVCNVFASSFNINAAREDEHDDEDEEE